MLLKDILKSALASKNTQAHRIVGDTKKGRQLIARTQNNQYIIPKESIKCK